MTLGASILLWSPRFMSDDPPFQLPRYKGHHKVPGCSSELGMLHTQTPCFASDAEVFSGSWLDSVLHSLVRQHFLSYKEEMLTWIVQPMPLRCLFLRSAIRNTGMSPAPPSSDTNPTPTISRAPLTATYNSLWYSGAIVYVYLLSLYEVECWPALHFSAAWTTFGKKNPAVETAWILTNSIIGTFKIKSTW